MSTLPLSDIVNVSVSVGPVTSVRTSFNLGLIIGKSEVISTDDRVKTYSGLTDMKADEWKGTEPEYLAAQIYFSQSPKPTKVAIGRWDETNEKAVQAVTACRNANSEWYACTVCGAEKEDIMEIASYIDSATPESAYFATTSDNDVLSGTDGNLLETLKNNGVHRSIVQYSTKTEDAIVAIMGYAMAANTQTSGSAYTLKFKSEVGVTTEDLNSTQLTIIKNNNGNVYINRGSVYNLFEDGVTCDGTHFDELINLDVLTNNIQTAIVKGLTSNSKIPQTDPGMDELLNYITSPLEKAVSAGFIAPGIWNASPILSVNTGDTLSSGYIILSDTISNQSQADREARKAPPIYILVKLAGAIESVAAIKVYVNR